MSEYQVAMEAMEKLRSGGFECQGGPLENNIDFKKVGVCLDALQRSREQNDRMRQWFMRRTGVNGLLTEQMKALDKKFLVLNEIAESNLGEADSDPQRLRDAIFSLKAKARKAINQ